MAFRWPWQRVPDPTLSAHAPSVPAQRDARDTPTSVTAVSRAPEAASRGARALLENAAALNAEVDAVWDGEQRARQEVETRFGRLRRAAALRDLRAAGVEQLQDFSAAPLPLAALRRGGVTAVGEVLARSATALSEIPGVGAQSATRLATAARALADATEDRLGLRIDLDPLDGEATAMLAWLRCAVAFADAMRPVRGTVDLAHRELPGLRDAAAPAHGRVSMLFAGSERRQAARAALGALDELVRGLTAAGLPDDLAPAQKLLRTRLDDTAVWRDFEQSAVRYYGLLGQILGSDDALAAAGLLPADVVDRIREQPLDATYRTVSLRGYQAFGAKFALAQRRALLGDEMGLGKTIQAIAAMAHLRSLNQTHFLVVCPASVVVNWVREIRRHSTLTPARLHGPDRRAVLGRWASEGGVAVTTYDTLPSLGLVSALSAGGVASAPRIGMLVADEAHYVKNPSAKRTAALRELLDRRDLVGRVIFLTGTPMENRLSEFRTLVGYLQPGLVPVQPSGVRAGTVEIAPDRFRQLVAPVYLRRNADEVLSELPDKITTDEWLEFSSPAEFAAYRDAVLGKRFWDMRQVAYTADPRRSRKLARLVEIAREAAETGQRVVVFSFFHATLHAVGEALRAAPDCGPAFGPITGSMPAERRQRLLDDFAASPAPAVLLSQVVAGGTGLNMQAASVVVLCEPQLKPSQEAQAIARLHRLGQVRAVRVHRLLTADSVDQRLVDILGAKSAEFDAYARQSDLASADVDAFDVSDDELTRRVLDEEYDRLARETVGAKR